MLHCYKDGQDCAKAVGLFLAWRAWLYWVAGASGQLPGVTSNYNHMPCLEVSHATMVWFWVVCGMLLSMLHAEGDMVGVLCGAVELMEQPVSHIHRS